MRIFSRALPLSVVLGLVLCVVLATPRSSDAAEQGALWDALRAGSAFAIMRHALAPGTGDPAELDLNDCTTQRNLSDEGRAQATSIGKQFGERGITEARIYSSEWCRCRETAELMGLGPVGILRPLNSFFRYPDRRDGQIGALRQWLSRNLDQKKESGPLVLVTHQVTITALTGVYPRSGEVVVARREDNGAITVLGSL